MTHQENFLKSAIFEFERYKTLGEETFAQLHEQELNWQYNSSSNSIAILVKHLTGNMRSRWTDFLTTDGEKPWRNRESEFNNSFNSKEEMRQAWEAGWQCLFDGLQTITTENFHSEIKIRGENHTLTAALHRQLAHYANHIGQIILLGKMMRGEEWNTLSIPKGQSAAFNRKKFNK